MYSVRYRNIENIDAETVKATMLAPANAGRRNSVRSSIGRRCLSSATRNTTNSTAEAVRKLTMRVEPQPFSLPSISANTSRNSEPENVTRPIQSTPVALGSRDSLTWLSVNTTAHTPIGTFTKKIHGQPMPAVITPPTTGPTATAAPMTAPNTPKATPRSLPWKASASSASEVANIIAPPTPCTARARFSASGLPARPQTAEEAVKTTRPAVNTRLRPIRSATEPAVSRNAASVNE